MKLKPCPFCAGSNLSKDFYFTGKNEEKIVHTIECKDCPAMVRADSEEAATEAWNRRDG